MKVLLHDRIDADALPGGDTVQIQGIADFLRGRGHEVFQTQELAPDLGGVDVAVLFNLTRVCDCYCQACNARGQGVPYIVFPIYWDLEAVIPRRAHPYTTREAVKRVIPAAWRQKAQSLRFIALHWRTLGRSAPAGVRRRIAARGHEELAAEVLNQAAAVCPNSRAEAEHLVGQIAGVAGARVTVILNGLFRNIATPPVRPASVGPPEEPFVLCVANIAPRKNQLNLVRAATECNVPVLLAGRPGAGCEQYVKNIRRAGGDRVKFLGHLPYAQLRWLYERAHAHVLPSYIETPGLSTLEAAAAGCHIIVGANGPVREYFGARAIYCDPDDVGSIVAAIRLALGRPRPGRDLADFIVDSYSMDRVLAPLDELVKEVARRRPGA